LDAVVEKCRLGGAVFPIIEPPSSPSWTPIALFPTASRKGSMIASLARWRAAAAPVWNRSN